MLLALHFLLLKNYRILARTVWQNRIFLVTAIYCYSHSCYVRDSKKHTYIEKYINAQNRSSFFSFDSSRMLLQEYIYLWWNFIILYSILFTLWEWKIYRPCDVVSYDVVVFFCRKRANAFLIYVVPNYELIIVSKILAATRTQLSQNVTWIAQVRTFRLLIL